MGLIDPSTSDGRVIFFLPWQGRTLAGTTDRKCDVTDTPMPTQDEIDFIINEVSKYFASDLKGFTFTLYVVFFLNFTNSQNGICNMFEIISAEQILLSKETKYSDVGIFLCKC